MREAFKRRLSEKVANIQSTAPIWGFDRHDRSMQEKRDEIEKILYSKGPVLLNKLEVKIGKENFIELCRSLVANNISTTDGFLEILGNLEEDEVKIWFETLLKTR